MSQQPFNRFASRKTPSISVELVDVTYQCEELQTIQFCQSHGLIASSIICENCGSNISAPTYEKSRRQWWWRCNKKPAGKPPCKNFQFSIKKGTFFDNSRLGFYQVLWLVWHFVHNQTHHNTKLHLDLGRKNDKTVVDWFNFCREVCDWWMENKSEKLGGPGVIVEIDESYMAGRQKNGKGRKLGQNENDENCTWLHPWALGALERGTLRCFLQRIYGPRSRENLLPILQQWILPGTTIVSDKWTAYIELDMHLENCAQHYTVNHSTNFVDPITGQHTQGVESLWHHLKYTFPPYSVQPHMLSLYLSKFVWMRHVKEYKLDPFLFFLKCAGELYVPSVRK